METKCIELDGSLGEGGGQILRTSLALALVTGLPFHLRHVRARRPKPGLQPQHLMSVRAAAAIGQARVCGASLGSTDLVFEPGPVTAGSYRFDIGTAGATSLVLHTLYLPLALRTTAPSELTLVGGTHVRASPCFHFLETTWRAYLERLGLRLALRLIRPGFYPRGGGVMTAHIQPVARLQGLTLRQRGPVTIHGFSASAGLPAHVARRQARRAASRLEHIGIPAVIQEEEWPGGPGSVLALVVETTGVPALFFALGARGKPAEAVADEAVAEAAAYLRATPAVVDAYSGDQLVLLLALADGASEYSVAAITPHLQTNIGVILQFIDRDIICEGAVGQAGLVRIGERTTDTDSHVCPAGPGPKQREKR
jgi:RNA 3'-terminal phosphate cyclase (ATP)